MKKYSSTYERLINEIPSFKKDLKKFQKYEGLRDLCNMLFEETDLNELRKIFKDLKECIADIEKYEKQ